MHICVPNDVTFTCIAISFHIYCTQFFFKHVILKFLDGMNKVFELNWIELNWIRYTDRHGAAFQNYSPTWFLQFESDERLLFQSAILIS